MTVTVSDVNMLDREQFVALLGPLFEQSPWIAAAAWPARPFTSLTHLSGLGFGLGTAQGFVLAAIVGFAEFGFQLLFSFLHFASGLVDRFLQSGHAVAAPPRRVMNSRRLN